MNYATNFAIIENGIVKEVLWGSVDNMPTHFPNCVQVDERAVQAGDTYVDGIFYHNGEEVNTMPEIMADMAAALELLGVTE